MRATTSPADRKFPRLKRTVTRTLTAQRRFTGPRGTNSLRRWNESGDYVISEFREQYRVVLEIEKNINHTNAL